MRYQKQSKERGRVSRAFPRRELRGFKKIKKMHRQGGGKKATKVPSPLAGLKWIRRHVTYKAVIVHFQNNES